MSQNMQTLQTLIISIIVFFAACVSPAIAAPQVPADAHKSINEIKLLGYPISPKDLNNYYPSANEQANAAVIYLEAYSQFKPASANNYPSTIPLFAPNSSIIYRVCDRLPDNVAESAELFLEHNQNTINTILQADQITDSKYPLTFNDHSVPLNNHHIAIRTLANLIKLRAIIAAHHLKNDEFYDNMLLYFGLIHSFKNEPTLPAHILQLQLTADLLEQIERAVIYQRLSIEQMKSLQNRLESINLLKTYRRALIGDRALMLVLTKRTPIDFNATITELEEIRSKFPLYLTTMETLITSPTHPTLDDEPSYQAINEIPSAVLSDYLSNYPAILTKTRNIHAQLQVTKTALALQQYRYDHEDKFPTTLRALTPTYLDGVPFDPFLNTRPIKYRYDDAGCVIYSIGQDKTDNAGREKTSDNQRTRGIPPHDTQTYQRKNLTDITISFLGYQQTHFPTNKTSTQPPKEPNDSDDQSSVLDGMMMDF
ncbi:hypothetical protein JD969_01370 [Planctomycetota bacterium]|nr:hypothetical protein JD969_01370 [Planctomycetota bacterium]